MANWVSLSKCQGGPRAPKQLAVNEDQQESNAYQLIRGTESADFLRLPPGHCQRESSRPAK